jgi:hypothetical protein
MRPLFENIDTQNISAGIAVGVLREAKQEDPFYHMEVSFMAIRVKTAERNTATDIKI